MSSRRESARAAHCAPLGPAPTRCDSAPSGHLIPVECSAHGAATSKRGAALAWAASVERFVRVYATRPATSLISVAHKSAPHTGGDAVTVHVIGLQSLFTAR